MTGGKVYLIQVDSKQETTHNFRCACVWYVVNSKLNKSSLRHAHCTEMLLIVSDHMVRIRSCSTIQMKQYINLLLEAQRTALFVWPMTAFCRAVMPDTSFNCDVIMYMLEMLKELDSRTRLFSYTGRGKCWPHSWNKHNSNFDDYTVSSLVCWEGGIMLYILRETSDWLSCICIWYIEHRSASRSCLSGVLQGSELGPPLLLCICRWSQT